jgi:two-component system, OmpR family, alkaline phosphatase synthesis response regulator PhoP
MNASVLLVEDEELVGTMVRMNLEGQSHDVVWVRDGQQAIDSVDGARFDLILLDISLPRKDGIEVLGELRKRGVGTPIMMLTARADIQTKVQALEMGADDYLPKPFDVAELLARVNALVRRSQADRQLPADQKVSIGGRPINFETREAETSEGRGTLSEKEAAIVRLLVAARGKVLSRSDIIEEVWGMEVSPTERTVDNFILRLRTLFEPEPARPRHIVTVRGSGYRYVP